MPVRSIFDVSGADTVYSSFNLILNEPAGKIAQIVVEHSVKAIVKAWEDTSLDPNRVAAEGEW